MNLQLQHNNPPIQHWNSEVFNKTNIQVDILRMDLIHPFISGNKWMKLQGFLKKAIADKKEGIITKGGPWSNHIHACAYACDCIKIPCHIWIKGYKDFQTDTIKDCTQWNAAIKYINRNEFYDENEAISYANKNNLLYIPMGGYDEVGINSVTDFLSKLTLPFYDYLLCAVGTGTTMMGAVYIKNNFNTIIGIEVGTNDIKINQAIKLLAKNLVQKELMLLDKYSFGGFAKYNPELINFINNLYARHQIPTDIVYTGKLFYAVENLAEESFFREHGKVLIIHSGGLQGNRSLIKGILRF